MEDNSFVLFGQKSPGEQDSMTGHIVMMQQSVPFFPKSDHFFTFPQNHHKHHCKSWNYGILWNVPQLCKLY